MPWVYRNSAQEKRLGFVRRVGRWKSTVVAVEERIEAAPSFLADTSAAGNAGTDW